MKTQYIEKNEDVTYYHSDKEMTKLHREDGPAIEYASGSKQWWVDGEIHREDGPAIEWASGSKEWYVNNKLHREDGPAVEWTNGNKLWFLNGQKLTEAEFILRTTKLELTLDEIAAKFGVDPKNLKIKK